MCRKKSKRIKALFLVLAMVVALLPTSVSFAGTVSEEVIYENDFESDGDAVEVFTGNKGLEFTAQGDITNNWLSLFQKELSLSPSYDEKLYAGAKLSFDLILPSTSTYVGALKAQAAVKMGAGWTWTQSPTIPEITESQFEDLGNGYKQVTVTIAFGEEVEAVAGVMAVVPCLTASNSDIDSLIYLDNVKLINPVEAGEEPELPEVEPFILEFNSADAINAWSDGGGYQYTGGLVLAHDSTLGAMQLDVDYSNNSTLTWSEAKAIYTFSSEKELLGYNQFLLDFIYDPAKMTKGSFKIKVVSGTLEKDIDVDTANASDYGEGLKKVTVMINFASAENKVSNFTLGLVGNQTDYKGSLFIDNIIFKQAVVEDIYVTATEPVTAQTAITVTTNAIVANGVEMETSTAIKLVDDQAITATRQLYAYLEAIGETDSVLFGHQNNTTHKAGSAIQKPSSDAKDITGSNAAVLGIDTLSLTGNELSTAAWDDTLENRVAAVAAATKEAVSQGAIVTLSAHMPNFEVINQRVNNQKPGDTTSDTVGILSDGSYNFSGYTPGVLTDDIVTRIMPGQDLNKYYVAYLDMVAAYAKSLETDNISVLFRPFHENTGSWFWWGKAFCDGEAYKNLYRYTVEYLRDEKDVRNFIYVYGPSSEASSVAEFGERYPGDDYVDMVGFDMYHNTPSLDDSFIQDLKNEIEVVDAFAEEHNKLFAVTETGVANGSVALLKTGNERKEWFNEVLDAIAPSSASYFLVWANFGENGSFYTPYVVSKKDDTIRGHEMLDNFIDFYNDGRSVFANQMGDFLKLDTTVVPNTEVAGYFTTPVSGSRVLDTINIQASVFNLNAESNYVVKFIAKNKTGDKVQEVAATKNGNSKFSGSLTKQQLTLLGESVGTLSLVVDAQVISTINLKFNMPVPGANPFVVDTFEDYYGEDAVLQSAWSTGKGSGCSIEPSLSDKKYDGEYGMKLKYTLVAGGYVGVTKSLGTSWTDKNALQFWTLPDGNKQKVVIQVQSGGNTFEVYLNEYSKYNGSKDPVLVTIPFSSFVGRDNSSAVFDASNIQSFGLWCNTIVPQGENASTYKVESAIYYDEIKAVTSGATAVTFTLPEQPGTGGGSTGGGSTTKDKTDSLFSEVTIKEGKRTVTTILFDEEAFNKKLQSEGNNAVFTISVKSKADDIILQLTGLMLENMKNKGAILDIKTENGSYKLPVQLINIEDILKKLGENLKLKDIIVKVKISKASDDMVNVIGNSSKAWKFSTVGAPRDFMITCTYGGRTIEITRFRAYVERTVGIPDGVDPSKVTTAVIVESNGNVRQVPTKIIVIDGKYYARISSLTNSTYTLIYNPLEFKDAKSHWARESINDMGSRLIINGIGNDLFEPDRSITRAEFAAIMVKALGLKTEVSKQTFTDVNPNDWHYAAIEAATDYGVISGYGNGKFGPMDKVTREQAMAMLANAMKVTELKVTLTDSEMETILAAFGDLRGTSAWAKESVVACIKAGLIKGKGNKIAPKDQITRAEVAVITRRLLQNSNLIE